MKTNAIVVDGTLYGLNPQLKLFALDAATGKERWVYDPGSVRERGKNIGRGPFASSTKISRELLFTKVQTQIKGSCTLPAGAMCCIASTRLREK
jgi:outer membrane protein assembly factor BamB